MSGCWAAQAAQNGGVTVIDEYTLQHLRRWASDHLYDDERDTVVAAMIRIVRDDPAITEHGWPAVRRMAESTD